MTAAVRIAEQLGGRRVLHRLIRTDLDLVDAVAEGLPTESVAELAARLELSDVEIFRLVAPRRTLHHRKQSGTALTAEESARVARVARTFVQALDAFGDAPKARAWLRRPNRALSARVPLALLESEAGARLVEDELVRIAFGVYA